MRTQQEPATGYPPPPASNGYPYAAPPPGPIYIYHNHNNINPNDNLYYYQEPYTSQRVIFVRRVVAGAFSVLLILSSILFFVWLILRPRVPVFHINSLAVSHLNATSSPSFQIFGNWTAQFTAFNPNTKMRAYYEVIEGYVYYKSELLAQNRLAPFEQDTGTQKNLSATLVASAAYVDDWVVSGVNAERSSGSVKLNVRIGALVHFKAHGWRTRRRLLRVFCDGLPVAMSSSGSSGVLTGGVWKCYVSL